MRLKKLTTIFAVPALSVSLAACSDTADDAPSETSAAPETVTEQVTETTPAADDGDDDQADDQDDQSQAAGSAQGDLPAEVTGYTGKAEAAMADEGVSAEEVERVLAAANNNEGGVEIEWDDDGYWEIEFGDIDIDVDPDGLVRDVDRDD